MAKRRHAKLGDQIRQAIGDSGLTRYRIAQETGLSEAALSRFVNGVCGLSLDSIDKVGECLGLEITTGKRKRRKSKGR